MNNEVFAAQVREIFHDAELTSIEGPLEIHSWATAHQPGYIMIACRSESRAFAFVIPAEEGPKLAQGLIECCTGAVQGREE